MSTPYRENENATKEDDATITTIERWRAWLRAQKRLRKDMSEEKKKRTSTVLWINASAHAAAAVVCWNGYMFTNPDASHNRMMNIIAWNFAIFAIAFATLSLVFVIGGCHKRFEKND